MFVTLHEVTIPQGPQRIQPGARVNHLEAECLNFSPHAPFPSTQAHWGTAWLHRQSDGTRESGREHWRGQNFMFMQFSELFWQIPTKAWGWWCGSFQTLCPRCEENSLSSSHLWWLGKFHLKMWILPSILPFFIPLALKGLFPLRIPIKMSFH